MNPSISASNIPAGIMDNTTEVFYANGELYAMHLGQRVLFRDLPNYARLPFALQFMNDHKSRQALQHAGVTDTETALEIYVRCLFGGFNHIADCDSDGTLNSEHWDCGCGGECPLSHVLRGSIKVTNGVLTQREIETCVRIASGQPGKIIAEEMGISIATLDKHKRSVFDKTGFQSNVEITVWVVANNIQCHGI